MGFVARLCQPSTLRMLIWPEASSAQNNMAAVSADGSTVCVLILRLNSSCSRSIAFVVRTLRHRLCGRRVKVKSRRLVLGNRVGRAAIAPGSTRALVDPIRGGAPAVGRMARQAGHARQGHHAGSGPAHRPVYPGRPLNRDAFGAICGAALMPAVGRGHVDLEQGVFYRRAIGRRKTKKRQPPVKLPPRLLAHMRRWSALGFAREAVVEWNGKPVASVRKGFEAAVRAADLGADVTPHVLRHTCATWLMQGGVDLWHAAGFLGMMVQQLEAGYGHHHPDYQEQAVAALTQLSQLAVHKRVFRVRRSKKASPLNGARSRMLCSVDQVCFLPREWRVGCGLAHPCE